MLLFSTMLEINDTLTKEAFVKLVITWNQNSPHSVNVIQGIEWNGEMNIRYGDSRKWLEINEYRNQNIVAIRYEKNDDDGTVWDTDYIMNFNEMKMAIQLDRGFPENAIDYNADYSNPYFIHLLIEGGYLKKDNDLYILSCPHYINEQNLYFIANVIRGKASYRLPVVYVSRTIDDEYPVNVNELARKLKGVAHVFAQTSRATNGVLRKISGGKNEWNGNIGIYYPSSAQMPHRYFYRAGEGHDDLLFKKVRKEVTRYATAQKIDLLYTWAGVNNALLTDRYSCQREERIEAEKDRDETRSAADALIEEHLAKQKELKEENAYLNRRIISLQNENQGLRAKLMENDSEPVLFAGDEKEFFPGEVKELILSVLQEVEKSGRYDGTRKGDLIKDIVRNNYSQHGVAAKRDQIKAMLNAYKDMDSTLRQKLMDFGFQITWDGKHYKLVYYGDERYIFSLPKTPSDWRSGKNSAADIVKKVL